jgi:hypothetical protein
VQEANSIGTAWSHIDLLPAAAQPKLRDTFRAYVDARIATYRALPDVENAKAALALSKELQGEVWELAVAATQRKDATQAATIVLMPQLQDMFSLATARIAASQIHPPTAIYEMLIALALVAAVLAGYQAAGERGYDWIHKIAFAGIVAATVYRHPRHRVPAPRLHSHRRIDQVLIDVRAGMKNEALRLLALIALAPAVALAQATRRNRCAWWCRSRRAAASTSSPAPCRRSSRRGSASRS